MEFRLNSSKYAVRRKTSNLGRQVNIFLNTEMYPFSTQEAKYMLCETRPSESTEVNFAYVA